MKHVFQVFDFDENTSAALNYYIVDGCRGEYDQLVAVEDLLTQLDEGHKAATDLQFLIENNKREFEQLCGGDEGSLDPLEVTIELVIEAFHDIIEIGDSATDALTCKDINSIWIDIVHDAVCTSAPSAFTWMFSSITAIYFSSIFIFMLRGALLPSKDIGGFDDVISEYTSRASRDSTYYEDERGYRY